MEVPYLCMVHDMSTGCERRFDWLFQCTFLCVLNPLIPFFIACVTSLDLAGHIFFLCSHMHFLRLPSFAIDSDGSSTICVVINNVVADCIPISNQSHFCWSLSSH